MRDDGKRLWREIGKFLDEEEADLDAHELLLVAELCRSADRLATIREALEAVAPAEAAWTRLASEERQRGLAMARLVSSIGLPTGLVDEDGKGATPRSRRAQKAAADRWEPTRDIREARDVRRSRMRGSA